MYTLWCIEQDGSKLQLRVSHLMRSLGKCKTTVCKKAEIERLPGETQSQSRLVFPSSGGLAVQSNNLGRP